MYEEALKYKMSVIVEVHTVEEAKKALNFKEAMIGINNRNLKTLDISLNTTVKLSEILRTHKNPLISESGISSAKDIQFIIKN